MLVLRSEKTPTRILLRPKQLQTYNRGYRTSQASPKRENSSLTQLHHHPPDPLPLHAHLIILPEKANITQIPLRQQHHHLVKPSRPFAVGTILVARVRDQGVIAVRLGEAQRLRDVGDGTRLEEHAQAGGASTAEDGGLHGVGIGRTTVVDSVGGFPGVVDVCALLYEESGDGLAAHG